MRDTLPPGANGELCARVEALAGRWSDRVLKGEQDRRLPAETVEDLLDSCLVKLVVPRPLGGLGESWPTLVEVSRRAARVCPSTGWIIGVVGGHGALAARLPAPARAALFADGTRPLFATGSVAGSGRITPTDGGVRVTGRWRFCSAIDHASWVIINAEVREGTDGPPERLLVPVRTDRVTIEDDWHVSGMSATGSKSINADDLFVPETHVDSLTSCMADRWSDRPGETDETGQTAGYLAETHLLHYMVSSVVGPILGCAEGAFDAFTGQLEERRAGAIAEDLAESSAELACARHLYRAVCATLHAAGLQRRPLTPVEAAHLSRDRAYLARLCGRAVGRLVRSAGTFAHFSGNPLSRFWRDVQMMTAHVDVRWTSNAAAYVAGQVASAHGWRH